MDTNLRWIGVKATPANRVAEVESTKTMVDRVEARFALHPQRLVGDTAYGTAPMLGWMVEEKGVEPHMPVWDKSARKDGTFSSSDFTWNADANEYRCPAGKSLRSNWRPFKNPRSHVTQADTVIYRASQSDCKACTIKQQCCPNSTFRKIARSLYENARDVARQIRETEAYERSPCERKKVEMLFAHLKRILKLSVSEILCKPAVTISHADRPFWPDSVEKHVKYNGFPWLIRPFS